VAVPKTIAGLRQLLARDYDLSSRLTALKESIRKNGQERIRRRLEEERATSGPNEPIKLILSVSLPAKLTSATQLEELIRQLHDIRSQASLYGEIELTIELKG
jgi:hypothetical protein